MIALLQGFVIDVYSLTPNQYKENLGNDMIGYHGRVTMIFLTLIRRNAPYTSAQVHKPNNPYRVDFWELR